MRSGLASSIVVGCLADACAVATFLASAPSIAVALHAVAIGAIALAPLSTSRRALCTAAVLAVPGAGAVVAAALIVARSAGVSDALVLDVLPRSPRPFVADLVGDLPVCDALISDPEDRRRALCSLASRADREGWATLQWAAKHRDPELALYAALVLDELDASPVEPQRGDDRDA